MIWNNGITEVVSGLSGSLWNTSQNYEKCLCSTNAAGKLPWWIGGLFSAVIPAVRLAPCHRGVGLTTSDEAPGREGLARPGSGLALGLGQLSEVVPPGRQMEDYVSCSHIPTAQSAASEESTSWALNHPESSGFCRCRSHQWNQNLVFQMERQTMHNMSHCIPCDRLMPTIKMKQQECAANAEQRQAW